MLIAKPGGSGFPLGIGSVVFRFFCGNYRLPICGGQRPRRCTCDHQKISIDKDRCMMLRFFGSLAFLCVFTQVGLADEPVQAYQLTAKAEATFGQFGLSDLKPITRAKARNVRGLGGVASTNGLSLVVGAIVDPDTSSSIFGIDANSAIAMLEVCGPVTDVDPFHNQQSTLSLELEVGSFSAGLLGGAGGAAEALFR